MTQVEFYYKAEGYKRRIEREFENTRLLAYMIHLSTPVKKHQSFDSFLKETEAGLSDDFIRKYWQQKELLKKQEEETLKQDPDFKWR